MYWNWLSDTFSFSNVDIHLNIVWQVYCKSRCSQNCFIWINMIAYTNKEIYWDKLKKNQKDHNLGKMTVCHSYEKQTTKRNPTSVWKYSPVVFKSIFVKKDCVFKSKYSEDDIIKVLEFLIDNIFVGVFLRERFSSRWSVYQCEQIVPLFEQKYFSIYMKQNLYSLCSQRNGNCWHLVSILHTGTSMKCSPLTTQSLSIIWAKCILLNLRSKTRQSATLLFLTRIYSCWYGWTVNIILPFMANVTISIC